MKLPGICCIILFVGLETVHGCTQVQPKTDIDWTKFRKDWYDVMDMPAGSGGGGTIDCFHWHNFTGVEGGFDVSVSVNVVGYDAHTYRDHFIRKRAGVYLISGEHKDDFIDAVTKANAHRLDADVTKQIIADFEWMASKDMSLISDNDNYLIFAMCTQWGPVNWVKFSTPTPSIEQIVLAWNALAEYGIQGSVRYNKKCMDEQK